MKAEQNKSVPELRFAGFTGDWNRWLFDEFATRGSGHTPSKSHSQYYGGDIDWVSLGDSNRLDNGYIDKTKTRISALGLKHSSAVLHPAGTVILSRDAGVGKSAVMKHSMAVSQHFIVWRPTDGISVNWFIYYWLQIMKSEFERIAIGSTIKTIGLPYFKKLELSAPLLPEQRKIADFLTAVDGRLAQLSQKKALLEAYKKGVMQQLFTQALRFQDDHGNDFPDWEETTLGTVILALHAGVSVNSEDGPAANGELGVLKTSCVTKGSFDPNENKRVTDSAELERLKEPVLANTIIISRMNTPALVGLSGLVRQSWPNLFLPDRLWAAKISPAHSPEWAAHLLGSPTMRVMISAKATGTSGSMKNITKDDVLSLPVSLPSLPEQTKIANFLTVLDRKIEAVAAQIAHTQTWKRGLLQQMFV